MQDLVDHDGIETLQLDVCDPASVSAARKIVEGLAGGKLDYLVNNAYVLAGAYRTLLTNQMYASQWRRRCVSDPFGVFALPDSSSQPTPSPP